MPDPENIEFGEPRGTLGGVLGASWELFDARLFCDGILVDFGVVFGFIFEIILGSKLDS